MRVQHHDLLLLGVGHDESDHEADEEAHQTGADVYKSAILPELALRALVLGSHGLAGVDAILGIHRLSIEYLLA